jgi:sterol desaturase/sphingolipid hydroxylase (fatty acid hydroxylase superfamily)
VTRPRLLNAAIAIGAVAALVWLERKRPLRKPVERVAPRLARNAAIGAVTAGLVRTIERPIVERIAGAADRGGWGVVPHLPLSPRARLIAAIVLMDYTLYWWHVLLHRSPALWRLHEPHHTDRDLDASTALRFHFLEFLASIPWRCAQVALIGASPRALRLWQKLTFAEVVFHHSNVRLPRRVEAWVSRFVVTPRMHGLHHSVNRAERDSNFSSGLSVWDDVHGTRRESVRDDVIIGLPQRRDGEDVTLVRTLALPFTNQENKDR